MLQVTSRSAAATGAAGAPPAPANAPSTPPSPAPSPAAAAAARAAMQFEFGRASSAGINGPLAVNGRPAVPSTFPPASSTTSSASVNGKNGHSNGHGVNGGRPSYISPPSSTTSNGNVAIHGKPAGLATSTSTVAAAAVAAATAVVTAVKASAAAAAAISSASSVLSSPLTPPSTHPPSSNASSHPQSPSTLDADADTAPLARLFSVSPAAGPVTDTQLMANDDPQVHLAAVHAALGTPRAIRQYTAALDAFLRGQCSSAYFSRFALQLFASRAESLSGGSSGDLGPDEAFVTAATAVTSQVVVPLRTRAAAPGAAAHNALVLSLLRATLHSHHAAASQAAVDCASAARAAAAAQQAARAAERAAQSPLAHPLPLPRKRRRLATEPQEDRRVRLRREAMALPVEDRDRIRRAFYAQFPDEAEAAAAAAGDLDQSVAAASAVISAAADANASVAPKRKRRKEKKVSAVGAANAGGDLAEAGSVDIDPLSGYVPPDRTGLLHFYILFMHFGD
ncbi:hypothetical protein BC828DRAFT_397889 [Blastocladiella britannica]|nr:hypothetical protein BC828DRAFT_397889 [Blastocladiella britannica]